MKFGCVVGVLCTATGTAHPTIFPMEEDQNRAAVIGFHGASERSAETAGGDIQFLGQENESRRQPAARF